MKNDFTQIIRDMQNKKFYPVYLFFGEETFLIDTLIDTLIKHSLSEDAKDFNLDVLYGNEIDGARIIDIAASYPMMSQRRIVIVKNTHLLKDKSLELLQKYANKPSLTTILVLQAQNCDKAPLKKIKACRFNARSLYDNQVPEWISSYLVQKKMTITPDALRLLHAFVGNSLRQIVTEIDKICLNIEDEKKITVKDIESVVGTNRQFNIFEFCDAVGRKNMKRSLWILNQMFQLGENPGKILSMLTRHFTILTQINVLQSKRKSPSEIAAETNIRMFFLTTYTQQAAQYKPSQLKTIFELLLEADRNLKIGYQKPKLVMETLLFKMNTL
ncbi:DNA polymerase III subunit delta [candidate division KSB1 bacterium]|nr:DNA polymerase III subunit delta [candidate division KSB1 bacterium]